MKEVAMGALLVSRKTVKGPAGDDANRRGQSQTRRAVLPKPATRGGAAHRQEETPGYREEGTVESTEAVRTEGQPTWEQKEMAETQGTGTTQRSSTAEQTAACPPTGVRTAGA
jgi:hypothetical protein